MMACCRCAGDGDAFMHGWRLALLEKKCWMVRAHGDVHCIGLQQSKVCSRGKERTMRSALPSHFVRLASSKKEGDLFVSTDIIVLISEIWVRPGTSTTWTFGVVYTLSMLLFFCGAARA